YPGAGVFLSTNNGTSWTPTTLTNAYINAFAVSGTNIFAGTGTNGVFLSTDNGTNWTEVNNGLTSSNDVGTFAVSGKNIFAGTQMNGVFLSTNNGTIWTEVNNGLMNTDVRALAVSGTNLFAGTSNNFFAGITGDGVWRRPLSEMITGADDQIIEIPSQFILEQNFPNPFNPSTIIQYAIGSTQIVQLKVYDVLGKKVATLVNEEKSAGSYEISFNATQLSSGIYFYKLHAGSFVETKKMLLLK
ncbi:MAG: T9SS type A sorting domain-containing protein, partial [Ignavibacteria bacterium]|nr:T9SS type A sorting domain-containing protein [Ignavibacteria bacterium]